MKKEIENERKKDQLFREHKPTFNQHFIRYMEGREKKEKGKEQQ